jgi:YGGT family
VLLLLSLFISIIRVDKSDIFISSSSKKEKFFMDNQPYSPDPRVQSYQENYVGPGGSQVETKAAYVEDKNLDRAIIRSRIATIAYFILAVLEIILLLRFIFRLLGASQSSGFVVFLYNLSHVFVAPFNGIFNDQGLGSSVVETSTLVAMLIWALIIWGLVSLSRLIFARSMRDQQSVTTIHNRRTP